MMCSPVRYGFIAMLAGSATTLFTAPALAGEPEADGGEGCADVDVDAHVGAECEVIAEADCHAGCETWVDATCGAQAVADCAAGCEGGASAECTASCAAECSADCQVGLDLDLGAWCEAECLATGALACAGAADAVACEADLHPKCAASCDLDLALDGLLGCSGGCEAACGASCEVSAGVECKAACEADVYAACTADLGAQCHAECDAEGAIVCDDAFVDKGDASDACIAELLGPSVELPVDEAPVHPEPHEDPDAAVGCAIDRGATPFALAMGIIVLLGLSRRRRKAA